MLAPSVKLQPSPHRSQARIAEELSSMSRVLVAKAFRNEDLHRVAQQFLSSVPEQFLGLRIDQRDLACSVNDDHGVRRRFQQPAEFRFRCFRSLGGLNHTEYLWNGEGQQHGRDH